jgi:hypothetical protein
VFLRVTTETLVQKGEEQAEYPLRVFRLKEDIHRMHVVFGSAKSRRHVACRQYFEVEAKEQKEQVVYKLHSLFLTAHIEH